MSTYKKTGRVGNKSSRCKHMRKDKRAAHKRVRRLFAR